MRVKKKRKTPAKQYPRYILPKWTGLPKTPEAYMKGAKAQIHGAPLSDNPFINFPQRQAWFAGYLDTETGNGNGSANFVIDKTSIKSNHTTAKPSSRKRVTST